MTPNQLHAYRTATHNAKPSILKLQWCPSCRTRRSVQQFAGGHKHCAKCRGGK